ncbi:chemotaxis protein CheA [Paralimibaculum aggregatum]|uniref:Chemotaxis protein CheA n=1 Tax=Paralimibaculum aggregatum TaxID=3036245 RepID=A0ABQ6LKH4_9RHOB|nr:chemotaxis protein CheA [Limibaculum sp. NKW23]GMG83748.1 chemotaxis protein CheA [Limibaculum sp. NKW23]
MPMPPLPVQTFMQEANEVLETLEARLLELEADTGNAELVDAVFRALHTLKGSGEMFGFTALARFTHSFENAYDAVRAGTARVSEALIDVSLRSRDHIQRLIDAGTDAAENARLAAAPEGEALLAEIAAFIADSGEAAPAAEAGEPETDGSPRSWHVRFRPEPSAIRNGMRPDLLIDELGSLGRAEITCDLSEVPPLEEIDPGACYLVWQGRITTDARRPEIEDIFLFADEGAFTIEPIDALAETAARGAENPGGPPDAPPAPPAAEAPARAATRGPAARKSDSVRVQSHRLDALMDQLGELVIAQARLNRTAKELADPGLIGTAEEIERLITGLRDATLSIRMLPIGTVFGKFRRVVRDLSAELGKEVALVTRGEETELDKNVIDSLSEPLVHIMRNAIDHGVEAAAARRAAGKPEIATVTMSARQSGGEVLVTVADDGAGLKTETIRSRAIARGLIDEADELSERQIHQLVFAPGFSTAESLSSVSGRGVGMDAVRSVIQDLGGAVELSAQAGRGTEITLKLPLTLAIIEGLLVRVAGAAYVLPLANVEECVELTEAETRRESGRAILTIRDELVPFLDLKTVFGFAGRAEDRGERIVIVGVEGRRVGLVVDDIVGQHQTVIKSLSPYHRDIAGLAGGTILGDGAVALIIDPVALVKSAGAGSAEAA